MSTLIKQWIAALRSGQYTQTQGFTKRGDSYCCLGVAVCLVDNDKWGPWREGEASYSHCLSQRYRLDEETTHQLVEMNDKQGKTFPEIADYLEQKYAESDPSEAVDCGPSIW